jgi:hypothetical protein
MTENFGQWIEQSPVGQSEASLYVAYDGTLGQPWTVVVRLWDAATTAWRGIATVGQIASSPEHAVELVRKNGPWPEGAEFKAHAPGDPLGKLVWGCSAMTRT